jgi:diguanylate cyclase (GGDEF)-like protein/PAS domain S-box-containing protein
LVNQSLVGIAIIVDGRFSYVNPKFVEMFGYSVEETQVLTIQDISAESDRQLVQEQVRRRVSGETDRADYVFRGRRKNGAEIDVECHSSVMEIGGRPALIDIVLDITARTKAEREMHKLQGQLREQAIHDPLTGLYNRRHLNEFFDRELKLAERHHHPISIVLGDLDHFKDVNDDYGHLAGDEILKVFGDLIKHSFRPSDISCRYGGEEFLIVLPEMEEERAVERTGKLRAPMEHQRVTFGASVISVTASFGISTYPKHGQAREELIAAADRALYAAKNAGRNQVKSCSQVVTLES